MRIKSGNIVYDKKTGYSGVVMHASCISANIRLSTFSGEDYPILCGPKSMRDDIIVIDDKENYIRQSVANIEDTLCHRSNKSQIIAKLESERYKIV
jgi:hypothetical protein